jgi:putative ABC transport system ATP-binding protein
MTGNEQKPTAWDAFPANPTSRPTDSVLTGRGLEMRYGETVALAGVDIDVAAQESVAIVGPSGSGKSTLLHGLAGIIELDHGEVALRGRRIDGMPERRRSVLRRRHFGFVFQSDQLLPELPAVENVALPLMLEGRSRAAAVRQAATWFEPLGLEGLLHRRPGELSGGQAQRVAIARALVMQPVVVFADEPTASLDRSTGLHSVEVLISSARAAGAAVVLVTHDAEVASRCDRTLAMRDGRFDDAALVVAR